jgi:ATP-dependent Lon protease
MAAQRSGVQQVFIPQDNEEDLRDVPEEVCSALKITPVREITDVLKALGIKAKAPTLRTPRKKAADKTA